MRLKKLNAVLGLGIIAAVLCHAGTMTFSLITFWYNLAVCKTLAHVAVGLLILHVLTSICIFFFCHDGSDMGYPRQNMRAVLQRVTAVLMMILIHFHTRAYAHMATGETLAPGRAVLTCALDVIFILSVCVHIAVSVSKSFVTLGWIGSSKTAGRIDRIAAAACILLGAVALFAVVRFFIGGLL